MWEWRHVMTLLIVDITIIISPPLGTLLVVADGVCTIRWGQCPEDVKSHNIRLNPGWRYSPPRAVYRPLSSWPGNVCSGRQHDAFARESQGVTHPGTHPHMLSGDGEGRCALPTGSRLRGCLFSQGVSSHDGVLSNHIHDRADNSIVRLAPLAWRLRRQMEGIPLCNIHRFDADPFSQWPTS
jgi:hypothetical protein